jgi:serine/threonine-protein kinase
MSPQGGPEPGSVILGKYRVERVLGSGGMGVVVEATHVTLEQRVAIKLLNSELAQSHEIVARFLREARIAARLTSMHVARVTDIGQTETGVPYLVMELLVGHDLATELAQRRTLPVSEAVDAILQACEGLAEAHGVGLVHRDLKPANLFLAHRPNRPPVVKVLDFGLSKEPPSDSRKALTATDSIFGTPQYMSPEQIRSTKNVDARTDQHALAMILFELIAGRPAFQAPNVSHLVVLIATAPPPRIRDVRSDVPVRLEQVLVRALAKKPEERFATLADFADAIAPFGSPGAKQVAKHVRSGLAPRESLNPAPPARPSSPQSDELTTAQLAPVRLPMPSVAAQSASFDPFRTRQRNQRIVAVAVAATILAAIGVAFLVASSLTDPVGSPAATDPGSPLGTPATEAQPSGVGEATVSPAGSASSAPASSVNEARAGAEKKPKTGGGGEHAAPPKPAVSSILGAFGERKK